MSNFNRQHQKCGHLGKCQVCLGNVPFEYYFGIGDEITCDKCGTIYFIQSKHPLKLVKSDYYIKDGYFSKTLSDN